MKGNMAAKNNGKQWAPQDLAYAYVLRKRNRIPVKQVAEYCGRTEDSIIQNIFLFHKYINSGADKKSNALFDAANRILESIFSGKLDFYPDDLYELINNEGKSIKDIKYYKIANWLFSSGRPYDKEFDEFLKGLFRGE